MKKKQCDHCPKKFSNRKSLIRHLRDFHELKSVISRAVARAIMRGKVLPPKEGKPLRRVRMMAHAMRVKKDQERVTKVGLGARNRQVARGVRK